MLRAVVHSRFIDARDGDGGRSLVDGQRAVFIGYIIVGRNCAALVFDGILINHVRGIARVGDGGGRRHGEGEVLLRIAVDQTLHFEIGLGQRLAVVGLLRVLGGDGQGHGVIDRDDIFGFVSHDLDFLRGSIPGHLGGGIGGIERIALVRRQLFADGLGAGLVVGNLDGGAEHILPTLGRPLIHVVRHGAGRCDGVDCRDFGKCIGHVGGSGIAVHGLKLSYHSIHLL